jgi:AraC-like DNA-binding protein
MRPTTIEQRRRLYLLGRVVIARHYRRPLTLNGVAQALASSPRQLTRAFAQFGEVGFHEALSTRRLNVAAQLLIEQPAIPVRDVARLVGFHKASHFARAFRGRYGITPAAFRAEGRAYARGARARVGDLSLTADAEPSSASSAAAAKAPYEAARPGREATQPGRRRAGAGASACRPQAPAGR